jgi:hypothetical protein
MPLSPQCLPARTTNPHENDRQIRLIRQYSESFRGITERAVVCYNGQPPELTAQGGQRTALLLTGSACTKAKQILLRRAPRRVTNAFEILETDCRAERHAKIVMRAVGEIKLVSDVQSKTDRSPEGFYTRARIEHCDHVVST